MRERCVRARLELAEAQLQVAAFLGDGPHDAGRLVNRNVYT